MRNVRMAALLLAGVLAPTLGGCLGVGTTREAALVLEPASAADAARIGWPEAESCPELLEAVKTMAGTGRMPSDIEGAPIAVLPLGDAAPTFDPDLPLPLATRATATTYRCLLTVAVVSSEAGERRVLRQAKLRSAYPTGLKRIANPRWKELQQALAREQREAADTGGVIATGDPTIDLIGLLAGGVLTGISSFWQEDGRSEIKTELGATPSFIEEPILTPYGYSLVELQTERRAELSIALLDQPHGLAWQQRLPLIERIDVALSDDRHPQDPTIQYGPGFQPMTSSALDAWERGAPAVPLSRLAQELGVASTSPPTATTLAQLTGSEMTLQAAPAMPRPLLVGEIDGPGMVEPTAGPAPDLAPHMAPAAAAAPMQAAEILRVGKDASSAGFFVTSDQLIVPASALTHSSLVALTYPDGDLIYGLVERRDEASGIALVYCPRPGMPVPLALSEMASGASPVEKRRGAPVMAADGVAGVWLAPESIVPASALEALLAGKGGS